MNIAAKLDDSGKLSDSGKVGWIVLTILAFVFYWPLGLGILAYLIWSGRMACWKHGQMSRWQSEFSRWSGGFGGYRSSGNRAFDEYRTETLRRLEEEQADFSTFLERLRLAKDKAEFDQFMAERRNRNGSPAPQPQ